MYEVGQKLNIGYYGGFRHQTLLKTTAEIISVDGRWVTVKLLLSHGAHRIMFGLESELKTLEKNYNK